MNPDSGNNSKTFKREQILSELPLPITSISPQKKNGDRFSLFHNNTYLVGVSSQSLIDFSIQKGTELTRDLFHKISRAEEYQAAKDKSFSLLARRDHGSEELRRKLARKGFSEQISDEVVGEFQNKELLNDRAYATNFTQDKHNLKQWGPKKIEAALYKKGVPRGVISSVVEDFFHGVNQNEVCTTLALKRKAHFLREANIIKRKQKIFRYLSGKGYSSSTIQHSMSTIINKLDAQEPNA
ncbi:MAG: hypothetical protein GVY08_12985 [Bacteroidetes bacterium]|jgi:regulatory protein|nr:hypothetical protein [Bacteroidota bacterium]